jgi:hypothetical protein
MKLVTQVSETSGLDAELLDTPKSFGGWTVGGPGTASFQWVAPNPKLQFSPNLVTTARVTSVLRNDPDLASSASKLAVKDGRVILEIPESELRLKAYITQRVKDVSGLKIVMVQGED